MPDVGLFTATEPLPRNDKVIIKYSVEVEGLPVYTETYDVDKIAAELQSDEARTLEIWARRILCAAACRTRSGFSSCLTRCLTDGQSCECGHKECQPASIAGGHAPGENKED